MYFAAFGIFTSESTMGHHCPGARLVGVGHVPGWRLEFRGCADTQRDEDSTLDVLVWEINAEHLERLDRVEGYPYFYDRHEVPVILADGEELTALMYSMVEKGPRHSGGMAHSVSRGWAAHGMNLDHLQDAHLRAFHESRGEAYHE